MGAKVKMVLDVDEGGEDAVGVDDVDAAAASEAAQLLKGGKFKRKESLIDRISRRFSTVEGNISTATSREGRSPFASDTGHSRSQENQVLKISARGYDFDVLVMVWCC